MTVVQALVTLFTFGMGFLSGYWWKNGDRQ